MSIPWTKVTRWQAHYGGLVLVVVSQVTGFHSWWVESHLPRVVACDAVGDIPTLERAQAAAKEAADRYLKEQKA